MKPASPNAPDQLPVGASQTSDGIFDDPVLRDGLVHPDPEEGGQAPRESDKSYIRASKVQKNGWILHI